MKNTPPISYPLKIDAQSSPITYWQWSFVTAWSLIMLGLVAAPIGHGFLATPSGWQFTGFIRGFHQDYNSYLTWMRQAYDGHVLFRDMYTTEPHSRAFFHPLFWLMGISAKLIGLPFLPIWYATHAAGCVLMIVTAYRFSTLFTDSTRTRMLSLVLVTTVSGFGYLTDTTPSTSRSHQPIDLWMAEANIFDAMTSSFFTLPIALGLMLAACEMYLRYLRGGCMRHAVYSGLIVLSLTATHPYDVVTLFPVLMVWTMMMRPLRFKGIILVLIICLPYCMYSLAVMKLHPVFSNIAWRLPNPTLRSYLIGLGPLVILGSAALVIPAIQKQHRHVGLLLAWICCGVLLLHVPIGFERKLLWGIQIPISLLAAMLLNHVGGIMMKPSRIQPVIATVFGITIISGSAIGSAVSYLQLFDRNREGQFGDFLPKTAINGFRWLEQHGKPPDVVISTPLINGYLPARTGLTVAEGHWAQTINWRSKRQFSAALFGPPKTISTQQVEKKLRQFNIRFILLDDVSAKRYGFNGYTFAFEPLVQDRHQGDGFIIWELPGG